MRPPMESKFKIYPRGINFSMERSPFVEPFRTMKSSSKLCWASRLPSVQVSNAYLQASIVLFRDLHIQQRFHQHSSVSLLSANLLLLIQPTPPFKRVPFLKHR
jgi:hypothetical protein